jgi:hypothetical protein
MSGYKYISLYESSDAASASDKEQLYRTRPTEEVLFPSTSTRKASQPPKRRPENEQHPNQILSSKISSLNVDSVMHKKRLDVMNCTSLKPRRH